MCIFWGGFIRRTQNNSNGTEPFDVNSIYNGQELALFHAILHSFIPFSLFKPSAIYQFMTPRGCKASKIDYYNLFRLLYG